MFNAIVRSIVTNLMFFIRKRFFVHACGTNSELPSNTITIIFPGYVITFCLNLHYYIGVEKGLLSVLGSVISLERGKERQREEKRERNERDPTLKRIFFSSN